MTKILALIDSSVYGASVCDVSVWFAKRMDASIDLVHVLGRREVTDEDANLSGSIGLGARSALLAELSEHDTQKAKLAQMRGRALLEDAQNHVRANGIAAVETRLRNAQIVETVADFENEAELIVIGKRGAGADFDTMHLGSNLERVVRSSKKPVLVASRAFTDITHFLVAFDGGNSAWKAIDYMASLRGFTDLQCTLITVGDNSNLAGLEKAAQTLKAANYRVQTEVLSGEPETAIADKLESANIGLLVMGAYGHSRIRNLIIGSTTTEMIRSCKVPVLLFR